MLGYSESSLRPPVGQGLGNWDITSAGDLVMLRDLINTGTCKWNGITTNTYKGNTVPAGGVGCTWYVTNDIDMSMVCGPTIVSWVPIGKSTSARRFKGNIEGNEHTISNLYINSTATYLGLFGYCEGATIYDLSVVNAEVVGRNYVSIFAGYLLSCEIGNSHVQGNVSIGDATTSYSGLFTGICTGTSTNRGLLIGCTVLENSILTSHTNTDHVGGLCGCAATADVINCKNYGNVSGYRNVGGISGYSASAHLVHIENCINYGKINGNSYIGGIAGRCSMFLGNVTNCKNYGEISGSSLVSGLFGLLGLSDGNKVSICINYGKIFNGGRNGGIIAGFYPYGITLVEKCYNYGDFESGNDCAGIIGTVFSSGTVNIDDCHNENYAACRAFVGIAGSYAGSNFPYTVSNCTNKGQCNLTGYFVGITGKCENIVDCTNFANVTTTNNACGIARDSNNIIRCINHGNLTSSSSAFNHYVYGISNINSLGDTYMESCENYGSINSGNFASGLFNVGTNNTNQLVINCKNYGDVTGLTAVGVGGRIVENCENHGTITATGTQAQYTAAGITGEITSATSGSVIFDLKNCLNAGYIVASATSAAGIIGLAPGAFNITNCHNTGNINGQYCGGIHAYRLKSNNYSSNSIVNCSNSGSINASGYCAGIVGGTNTNTVLLPIINCTNSGSVNSNTYAAGIAVYYCNVINCINTGDISGSNTGGIIVQTANCLNCYNSGSVYGVNICSGIGNASSSHYIDTCLNTGDVTSGSTATPQSVGAISGTDAQTTHSNNYYDSQLVSVLAFRNGDFVGQGEGRVTSNIIGNGLLGAGSNWNINNWVFTPGEYPLPKQA